MKIPKHHDINGYQKLMQEMIDKCIGNTNKSVAMCIKSKNLVESKLADLRQQRDSLNELIGEYKSKAEYARFLIIEVMRANDLTEAGCDENTVKRIKCGRPAIVERYPDTVYRIPATYTKTVLTLNKKLIFEHIKDNNYIVPDEFKEEIKLEWRDRLKFAGD